jgi:hypothetical protein
MTARHIVKKICEDEGDNYTGPQAFNVSHGPSPPPFQQPTQRHASSKKAARDKAEQILQGMGLQATKAGMYSVNVNTGGEIYHLRLVVGDRAWLERRGSSLRVTIENPGGGDDSVIKLAGAIIQASIWDEATFEG